MRIQSCFVTRTSLLRHIYSYITNIWVASFSLKISKISLRFLNNIWSYILPLVRRHCIHCRHRYVGYSRWATLHVHRETGVLHQQHGEHFETHWHAQGERMISETDEPSLQTRQLKLSYMKLKANPDNPAHTCVPDIAQKQASGCTYFAMTSSTDKYTFQLIGSQGVRHSPPPPSPLSPRAC